MTIGFLTYYFSTDLIVSTDGTGTKGKIADYLYSIAPDFAHGIIQKMVVTAPWIGIGFIVLMVSFFLFRISRKKRTAAWAEHLRKLYITLLEGNHILIFRENKN